MMTLQQFFARLVDAGVAFSIERGDLHVSGPDAVLTAPVRSRIDQVKPAIIAQMRGSDVSRSPESRDLQPRRYLLPPECFAPIACSRLGPCERHQRCGDCRSTERSEP